MQKPESPCCGVCSLDEMNYCLGCLRTLDEIERWDALDIAAQLQVIASLPARRRDQGER